MYTKSAKIAHAGINCKGYINGRELFAFSGPRPPLTVPMMKLCRKAKELAEKKDLD